MSYGIAISNGSNYVQIDQDYSNHMLWQQGTVGRDTAITLPPNAREAVFIGRPSGGVGAVCMWVDWVNNTWRILGDQTVYQYAVYCPSNRVVESSEEFGIQVFRPGNILAFSSRQRALKIVMGSHFQASTADTNIYLPGGPARYGLLNSSVPSEMQGGVDNPEGGTHGPVYDFVSNNHVRVRVQFQGLGPNATLNWNSPRSFLITEM